jgi:hypothetical protein
MQLLLLERELNPPLVDAAVDVESERSNRSADVSPEVAEQSTSRRSRILDWLEELSMPRTKNVCGGVGGGHRGVTGKRRMRGRRSSEEERKTHLGYSVGDSAFFVSFFKSMRPILAFGSPTTVGDSLTMLQG